MKYIKVKSSEVVWSDGDDRYILIVKEDDKVVGLNFMQGDELDIFMSTYNYIDQDLTDFYNAIDPRFDDVNELDMINRAIWAYLDYKNSKDSRSLANKGIPCYHCSFFYTVK
jgi:hypothetical protein